MSRHEIELSGGRVLTVGWDPALQTFFGVLRAPGHEEPVVWVGADLHELYDLDDLMRALSRHPGLGGTVTPKLARELYADKDENRA